MAKTDGRRADIWCQLNFRDDKTWKDPKNSEIRVNAESSGFTSWVKTNRLEMLWYFLLQFLKCFYNFQDVQSHCTETGLKQKSSKDIESMSNE